MTWKFKTEQKGDYIFASQCHITQNVCDKLGKIELAELLRQFRQFKDSEGGSLDYLVVATNEKGDTVWIIDQLTPEEAKEMPNENYWTVLLPEDY